MHNSNKVVETESPAIWFLPDLSKPVTRSQNNGIKMGGHKQSKSWISKFTNFHTSLHSWHILLQHKKNTYHIIIVTITAQTVNLPSNMSSPRFSSEVPWWKYFPENPKLNRKPGTSCWIRCCVAKIACRHEQSIQITSLQTLNTHSSQQEMSLPHHL